SPSGRVVPSSIRHSDFVILSSFVIRHSSFARQQSLFPETRMHSVRIGNGCGFWGDNVDAPIQLAERGHLDYLTLEYLAELTMSILALQKQRDPEAGSAGDFLDVLERLIPTLRAQSHLKIVTNAGGMNPAACAAKARTILDQGGLTGRRVAVVSGDDLLPR